MNARRVHAVLAAGIQNPELIARWSREPHRLLEWGIEPGSLDLAAMAKFAGLTVKVRHNKVRDVLPSTFRLMSVAGLETDLFAAYALARTSTEVACPRTTRERVQELIAFLEGWLDMRHAEHALLWDLIRHEEALDRLAGVGCSERLDDAVVPGPHAIDGRSVPRVCGELVLHEMRCDPREVVPALWDGRPRLPRPSRGTRCFGYWRRAAELRILELETSGFYLLSLVDGRRSLADISLALGGGRRPLRGLLRLFAELVGTGIVRFQPSGSDPRP